ncbi:MAG: nitronate monooxygenase [Gammaproteobacteria bacterium]|nr:MAG: nitronate monooxygenase [Gammaproteobacteria bacterium]UTW43300.1 nitronate monooxygenase [bacterium SCSIO 12844]
MWNKTYLTHRIGIKYPIIQAPMAGGATTAELVSSVSNYGALGSLGAGYLSADQINNTINNIYKLTEKPFSVNLFTPEAHTATTQHMQKVCDVINQCSDILGVITEPVAAPYAPVFEEQVSVLLAKNVPVVSFTFGIPSLEIINQFKKINSVVIATATSLEEACLLENYQVDAIVIQGSEAGGHRGSFLDKAENSLIPLADLLNQVIAKVNLPVIASGGIMNGASIAKLMRLGASATQLGSAFLCADESGIHQAYKKLLLEQTEDTTTLTSVFSGKLARGLNNQFIQCMQKHRQIILDYPIQNKLTTKMRNEAKKQGNTDYMSLWAGQNIHLATQLSAKDLLDKLISEVEAYISNR